MHWSQRQTALVILAFMIILFVLSSVLFRDLVLQPLPRALRKSCTQTVMKYQPSKFLYMLQTESCLSDYLQEVIGEQSDCPCKCDVLVLSYRAKCNIPPPSNIQYIYTENKTSWGGGRNVLYEAAMKREQVYLYFIAIDDDIVLTDRFESEKYSNCSPWRNFEEFLERVEPAAAAVDFSNKHWLQRAANGRKFFNCQSIINVSSEYVSVARYDAAFNAFHNKSIRHILPYPSSFDLRGMWNFSPIYVNIKLELLYAGHSVLHTQIFATNSKHRPYPKQWPSLQDINRIADEVANDLPEIKTKNSCLLSGWRRNALGHEEKSPTVCIPPPFPKMPIIEYAYIDGNLTSSVISICGY